MWLFVVQAAAHPAKWSYDHVKVKVNFRRARFRQTYSEMMLMALFINDH